jgi:hypothetical protein
MAFFQIIQDNDGVASLKKGLTNHTSDITGPAGD